MTSRKGILLFTCRAKISPCRCAIGNAPGWAIWNSVRMDPSSLWSLSCSTTYAANLTNVGGQKILSKEAVKIRFPGRAKCSCQIDPQLQLFDFCTT